MPGTQKSKSALHAEVASKWPSGGPGILAVDARATLDDIVESYPNIVDGGGGGAAATIQNVISAGVYDSNGELVRTLWSNRPQTLTADSWDGLLDDGTVALAGQYTLKVLTGTVNYTWEGVVGNTNASSVVDAEVGNLVACPFQMQDQIYSMAIPASGPALGNMYICCAYNEARVCTFKVPAGNPTTASYVLYKGFRLTGAFTTCVATDGTMVYWGGGDATTIASPTINTGVYGSLCSDDSAVPLGTWTGGAAIFWNGITYPVIDNVNLANAKITGLAVQQTSNYLASGKGYLFVTRSGLNSIHVLNKSTGVLAQTLTVNGAAGCCICDTDANLWVLSGTTATKYPILSTGALGAALGSITGLSNPVAIAVTPDNSRVAIVDSGSAQQVKFFSNSTFVADPTTPTLGTLGGYATDPTVSFLKFMFNNPNGISFAPGSSPSGLPLSFIAFEPAGAGSNSASFWFGDPGNFRSLHFSPIPNPPAFIEQMAWIGTNYNTHLCQGDPTRLFTWMVEYAIDYSKPLAQGWTLKNNWSYGLTSSTDNAFYGFKSPTIISGRTYTFLRSLVGAAPINTVELVAGPGGGIRITPNASVDIFTSIAPDGSLITTSNGSAGGQATWTRKAFAGLVSGNPTYGASTVVSSPVLGPSDPLISPQIVADNSLFPTTGGVLPVYDGDVQNNTVSTTSFTGSIAGTTLTVTAGTVAAGMYILRSPNFNTIPGTIILAPIAAGTWLVNQTQTVPSQTMNAGVPFRGYHLGGVNSSNGSWAFRTAPSTVDGFGNPTQAPANLFPQDGYFDTGHAVVNAGGSVLVSGSNILYQYYGEGWEGVASSAETNKWRHYHESGLLVAEFGVTQNAVVNSAKLWPLSNANRQAGIAGNAFCGAFTIVSGVGYVYHNDEGFKAGTHRWRIDGLSTLAVRNVPVTWGGSYVVPPPSQQDMLAGLPNSCELVNGTAGWTRSPVISRPGGTPYYSFLFVDRWSVTTNSVVYDPKVSPDLYLYFVTDAVTVAGGGPQDANVIRQLPNASGLSWKLTAVLQITSSAIDAGSWIHIEIADSTGLIIMQLVVGVSTIVINGTTFVDTAGNHQALANAIQFPQQLIVEEVGIGTFNVTYAGVTKQLQPLNAASNSGFPATFAVRMHFQVGNYGNPQCVNISQLFIR